MLLFITGIDVTSWIINTWRACNIMNIILDDFAHLELEIIDSRDTDGLASIFESREQRFIKLDHDIHITTTS